MQDRPYDEMSEEKETREIHDTKNGAQVGVYYSVPLLWPQYRIPDEEFSWGPMRNEIKFDKELDVYGSDSVRVKSRVEYSTSLP